MATDVELMPALLTTERVEVCFGGRNTERSDERHTSSISDLILAATLPGEACFIAGCDKAQGLRRYRNWINRDRCRRCALNRLRAASPADFTWMG